MMSEVLRWSLSVVSANKVRLLNPSNRAGETMCSRKELNVHSLTWQEVILFYCSQPVNVDSISAALKRHGKENFRSRGDDKGWKRYKLFTDTQAEDQEYYIYILRILYYIYININIILYRIGTLFKDTFTWQVTHQTTFLTKNNPWLVVSVVRKVLCSLLMQKEN